MVANFQLAAAVASLETVVTTATGAQRKIELGNTVESINAAQRVENVPVRTMGEMLTAQATGVQVIPATVTGTASRIRICGQASRARSNDPIYFVDGVRINAGTGGRSHTPHIPAHLCPRPRFSRRDKHKFSLINGFRGCRLV